MADDIGTTRKEQSIRLFRNDFLEALTHVHPIVPLLFWGPVAGYLLWRSVGIHGLPVAQVLGVGVVGVLVWTLAEYCLHRFVFRYPAGRSASTSCSCSTACATPHRATRRASSCRRREASS